MYYHRNLLTLPVALLRVSAPATRAASGTKVFKSLPLPDFRVWGVGIADRPGRGGGYIFDTGNEGRRLLWDMPLVKNIEDDVQVWVLQPELHVFVLVSRTACLPFK